MFLHLEKCMGEPQPWEDAEWQYPSSLAAPQQILTDASNGASDYGNKFGEPVVAGYLRTFGQRLANGERREWIKPIMFRWGTLALLVHFCSHSALDEVTVGWRGICFFQARF